MSAVSKEFSGTVPSEVNVSACSTDCPGVSATDAVRPWSVRPLGVIAARAICSATFPTAVSARMDDTGVPGGAPNASGVTETRTPCTSGRMNASVSLAVTAGVFVLVTCTLNPAGVPGAGSWPTGCR